MKENLSPPIPYPTPPPSRLYRLRKEYCCQLSYNPHLPLCEDGHQPAHLAHPFDPYHKGNDSVSLSGLQRQSIGACGDLGLNCATSEIFRLNSALCCTGVNLESLHWLSLHLRCRLSVRIRALDLKEIEMISHLISASLWRRYASRGSF